MRRFILPLIAFLGIVIAIFSAIESQKKIPPPPILFPPPTSPYGHFIAGAGIIEASSQNINIGSPFNEIVTKVHVIEGDVVKAGDPLIELDIRAFQAQVEVAKANLCAAETTLEDKQKQFSFYERLQNKKSASELSYTTTQFAAKEALENVKIARANLAQAEMNVERSILRAPIAGKILQVNAHVGELAPVLVTATNSESTSMIASQGNLILMGSIEPLQIRINIDEDEAWRFKPGAEATVFVRGNSHMHFPVHYVRTEPYIIPKASFTGSSIERVDTRVLQVLYQFEAGEHPLYTGQILDVFIESDPIEIHSGRS